MIGWIAWTAGKRAATYAAKDAAKGVKPAIHPKTKKPNKSAILLGVAAVVGVLAFWRTKRARAGPMTRCPRSSRRATVSDTVSQV